MEEKVFQASPATCVKIARQSIINALAELHRPEPDLGHVEFELTSARAWLPAHLEDEWDDTMAEWLHKTNERVQHLP